MLVALCALFVALGGTSYAALTISGKNIKNNTVTSADVRNSSLLKKDFRTGQLPAGAQGARGPQGAKGDTGSPGAPGNNGATNVTVRAGMSTAITPTATPLTAACNAGERATGGGVKWGNPPNSNMRLGDTYPSPQSGTPTGWGATVSNDTGIMQAAAAYVVCAAP